MELAMDTVKDKYTFKVRWEPFLLRPDMPPDGSPKPPSYTDPNNPRFAALTKSGTGIGLDFTNQAEKFPNTVKSHALLEYAKENAGGEKQNDVAEILFRKYFSEKDTLAESSILDAAGQVGFDKEDVKRYISDEKILAEVVEKAVKWYQKGISGVPTFYMNGQKIFSGAQDQSAFLRMFEIVSEKFPVETSSKS